MNCVLLMCYAFTTLLLTIQRLEKKENYVNKWRNDNKYAKIYKLCRFGQKSLNIINHGYNTSAGIRNLN